MLECFVVSCFRSLIHIFFFFSSRRRHTRFDCDWSSDVCSSDLRIFFVLFRPPFFCRSLRFGMPSLPVSLETQSRRDRRPPARSHPRPERPTTPKIGRASCRERV